MPLGLGLMFVVMVLAQLGATPTSQPAVKAAEARAPETRPTPKIDPEIAAKLLKVKRIYVDSFGDDNVGKQLQAMVINSLNESRRFIITENKERADAIMRGGALEKTSQEFHAMGEGTAVGMAAGAQTGSVSGVAVGSSASVSGSHSGGFAAKTMATEDTVASTETINDARLAVRLVATDGDVIWTTTQESKGAKYKGASADVADRVVKQLLRDLEKLEKPPEPAVKSP